MRVNVEPYNPLWASEFERVKRDLERILDSANIPVVSIEHVGSTSVPGLAAKPIIDIDIVVSAAAVHPTITVLEQTGLYKHLGECGIPQRYALRYLDPVGPNGAHARNTYVCVEGCQALRNHLTLRDLCRANLDARDEYARVKLDLSQREWVDVNDYAAAKSEVIANLLSRAGMGDEVDRIKQLNLQLASSDQDKAGPVEMQG